MKNLISNGLFKKNFFFSSLLKEAITVEQKKTLETEERSRRKSSPSNLTKIQAMEIKKANLQHLNLTNNIKSGFNKRLLSKLGCHLIIKLINTEIIHDVV